MKRGNFELQPPLVKLGYALTVVIEKLMNDRAKNLTTSFYDIMQVG